LSFYFVRVHRASADNASKTVKIGVYDNKPKVYRDGNGVAAGFYPDILNYIAKQENWQLNYIFGTFDEGLTRLKNGEVNIVVDVAISDERKQLYDFTNDTVLNSWGVVLVPKNSTINTFTDLEGKKIAILNSSVYLTGSTGLPQYLLSFGVKANIIKVNEYAQTYDMLNKGLVDAAVDSRISSQVEIKNYPNIKFSNIIFSPTELRFALTKNAPDNAYYIERLDFWIAKLKANPSSIYYLSLQNNGLGGLIVKQPTTPVWLLPLEVTGSIVLLILLVVIANLLRNRMLDIKKLEESEAKFRSIFDTVDRMIVLHEVVRDRNGKINDYRIIDCNPAFSQISGVPKEKAIGLLASKLYGSYEIPYLRYLPRVLTTGQPLNFEGYFKVINKYLKVSVFTPSPGKLAVIASDISELKKSEDELKKSNIQTQAVYDQTVDVLFNLSVESVGKYRFLSANNAFYKVTGLNKNKVIGKLVNEVVPEPSLSLVLSKYNEAIKQKRTVVWEEITKYPKEVKYGEVSVGPIFDDTGKCTNLIGTVHDITQRKEAEQILEESEVRFRKIFENAQFGIVLVNAENRFIKVNSTFCKITGYSERELLKLKFTDITTPEHIKEDLENVAKLKEGKSSVYTTEKRYVKKGGGLIWAQTVVSAVRNSDHSLAFYLTMIQDISQRKAQEDALRISEDKFSRIFNSSPYAITITRIKDGKFIDVNKAFTTLTGISRKEALSKTTIRLNVWANKGDRDNMISELMIKGFIDNHEFMFRTKTRGVLAGLYAGRLFQMDGEQYILSSISDISKLKRAQEKVAELEERNKATLTSIGDAVFSCDKNGKVLVFNKAAENLTGLPSDKIIGKTYNKVMTFLREADEKPLPDFVSEVVNRNKIIKNLNHTLLLSKNGKKIPIVNSIAPIRKETGEVVGAVVSFRDVTTEREIDRAKTEFVSLASHQLRTPLTAINWYCEMLLSKDSEKLSGKQRVYANAVYKANKRMVTLMNAILNVSRIEMGTFVVEPKSLNIKELAKDSINELRPQIVKRKIVFTEKYDSKFHRFKADPKLLTIIFQNLLSNAIKYTRPGGKISLDIHKDKKDALITVTDTGIGIPEKQQGQIFTKLFRADNVRAVDPDGSGLGLYIIKSIVESSKGKVWFKSREGKGSSFYVSLPLSGMTKKPGTRPLI
jgi:PAS domain S-box-containing protein